MSGIRIWGRLVWKNARESWLVVVVTFVIPAAMFSLAAQYKVDNWRRDALSSGAAFLVTAVFAFWGVRSGAGKRKAGELPSGNLPIKPFQEWASGLAMRAVLSAALGAWFGYWFAAMAHWTHAPQFAFAGALLMAATFAVAFLISGAISGIAGAFFSLLWPFFICQSSGGFSWIDASLPQGWQIRLLIRLIVSSLVGTILIMGPSKRGRGWWARAFAVLLVVAAVPTASHKDMIAMGFADSPKAMVRYYGTFESPDGSYSVSVSVVSKTAPFAYIFWQDKRTGRHSTNVFLRDAALVGVREHRYVYVLEQPVGTETVGVLVWDTLADRVHPAGSISAPEGSLVKSYWGQYEDKPWPLSAPSGTVSPDGRYLLTFLNSRLGNGRDLWVFDLETGRKGVALANTNLSFDRSLDPRQAGWVGNTVYLYGQEDPIAVDLRTFDAHTLDLFARNGGRM